MAIKSALLFLYESQKCCYSLTISDYLFHIWKLDNSVTDRQNILLLIENEGCVTDRWKDNEGCVTDRRKDNKGCVTDRQKDRQWGFCYWQTDNLMVLYYFYQLNENVTDRRTENLRDRLTNRHNINIDTFLFLFIFGSSLTQGCFICNLTSYAELYIAQKSVKNIPNKYQPLLLFSWRTTNRICRLLFQKLPHCIR